MDVDTSGKGEKAGERAPLSQGSEMGQPDDDQWPRSSLKRGRAGSEDSTDDQRHSKKE